LSNLKASLPKRGARSSRLIRALEAANVAALLPLNPASDAFHAKLGFAPVGQAALECRGKTVRYLAAKV